MGTKKNPSKYDAYTAAYDDEPIFTLRANDPLAVDLVVGWAHQYAKRSTHDPAKLDEALNVAKAMREWRADQTKLQQDLFHRYKRGELVDVQDHVRDAPVVAVPMTVGQRNVFTAVSIRNFVTAQDVSEILIRQGQTMPKNRIMTTLAWLARNGYVKESIDIGGTLHYSIPNAHLNNSEGGQ
jgi:Fe2+ or Zn2+ uptake regulation protein